MAAELLAFIDSSNTTHNLDGSSSANPRHVAGRQGFYMPPIAQLGQRTPGQPGEIIRYTDYLPRIFTVPLLVRDPAGSEATFQAQLEAMLDTWFANPGTFRSTKPSGAQRDLNNCVYLGGMELDENLDSGVRGAAWAYVTPQFEAPMPFWEDTTATTTAVFTNTQLLAGQTITNNGAYLCYPTWTFTSPITNLVITNTTTGLAIKLTANGGMTSLINGDTFVINTAAGAIIKDGATSQIQFLTTDSVLFPLVPGANAITFAYTSGVLGQTTGQASFKQRYRSL
jgi:hypothetical protein